MQEIVNILNNLCEENNCTINSSKSITRCINNRGELLIAYSKRSKSVKIYIDSLIELKLIQFDERETNILVGIFKTNHVTTTTGGYYSNQITINTIAEARAISQILQKLLTIDNSLRKYTLTRRTLSPRTQLIVNTASELTFTRQLKFGVEMEIILEGMKISKLRNNLRERGIKISEPNSTHEVCKGWKIVSDGSIGSTTGEGYEIVSPPSSNLDELKIVCEELDKIGARVNRTCGLHVHHDIKELKRKQILRIYNFYNKYNNIIRHFLKNSRIENGYCKDISEIIERVNSCESKEDLLSKIAGKGTRNYYYHCRYYCLNLRSYLFYGTIEFRQHHGSIDFDEISSWILFTHKIIERALEVDNDIIYNLDNESSSKILFDEMMKELKCENTTLEKMLLSKARKLRKGVA